MLRNLLAKFGHEKQPAHADVAASAPADGVDAAARAYDEGRRQFAAGRFAQAESSLRQALELKHDFGAAHVALGDVMAATAQYEDALDCYQLAVHFSPDLTTAHIALAAALLDQRRDAEAEAACRAALVLDPVSSAAWFCLGNVLKLRGTLEQACDAYRASILGDANNVNALQQLAFVEYRLGRYDAAGREFGALLAAAPDSANAHHNFGLLQLETGYVEEALASFRRALALQPGTAETLSCSGHALRDLGRFDEAISAYDAALALRPDYGDVLSNRTQMLLLRGDYTAGWRQYEQRFVATATRPRSAGAAAWQGEALAGRSIAVLSEQGIGDEIMFASCLPDLLRLAGRVVIACEPRLVSLFARSFAQAAVLPRDHAETVQAPRPDYEISIGSLPLHFRPARTSFPPTVGYLHADPARVAHWHSAYGADGKRRIGIAWCGGTLRNRQFLRSFDLVEMASLLRRPGCEFVSLQFGDRQTELRALKERCGVAMRDVAGEIGGEIDELAAAIAALDLVITADNTIAHLAGALGKPVWVLLPFSPEWRYGRDSETMDWYPAARLFRQRAPRDWRPVFEQLAQQLSTFTAAV